MNSFLVIEHILRNRVDFFDEVRNGDDLSAKIRDMLISSCMFFALYGLVMGYSNSWMQALSSAVKLPVLFLITLVICPVSYTHLTLPTKA